MLCVVPQINNCNMKKKIISTQFLQFLLTALVFAAFIGCDQEEPKPKNCSENIDLGLFSTSFEVPYDSFETIEFEREAGGLASATVNHPSYFSFLGIQKTATTSEVFDCEAFNSVEKYNWKIESKQTIISIDINSDGNPEVLMIKETPLVDQSSPKDGEIGIFLEFFDKDEFSGLLHSTEFMRIMAKELQAGKGAVLEKGHTFLDNISIKGETFEEVYSNTEKLSGAISNIYYNKSLGLIGFKDKDNILWRVSN